MVSKNALLDHRLTSFLSELSLFFVNVLSKNTSNCSSYAWFNFTCYHPPPGNPRDKSSPLGPGVANCLKRFCPGGREVGQIENNFSFFL